MKKLMLVFLAAFMAVGLSAFTSNNFDDVYYKNDQDVLTATTATPCPNGQITGCWKAIPELFGADRQLFHGDGAPYMRNQ